MSKTPGAMDNFQLIDGIGPGIERRLHKAGIVTFSQLAGLSAEAIAEHLKGLVGMSAERIEEQEWIRQAEEQTRLSPLVEATPQEMAGNGQHYATFTVELLLEETNEVRRTRIVHVQNRDKKDTWAGWNAARLVRFIEEQAALQPAAAIVLEQQETAIDAAQPEPAGFVGDLKLRELEVIGVDRPGSSRLMSRERPFEVRLVLDMEEMQGPSDVPLHYSAQLYAKALRDGQRHVLGQTEGEVPAAESLVIQVPAKPSQMKAGAYRLEADIALRAPSGGELQTIVPGTLVQLS